MIITTFINMLFALITFLLIPITGLDDVVLNSKITDAITTTGGYLNSINAILPVDTMLEILAVGLAFELGYLIYKIIMWVIRKIPTIN